MSDARDEIARLRGLQARAAEAQKPFDAAYDADGKPIATKQERSRVAKAWADAHVALTFAAERALPALLDVAEAATRCMAQPKDALTWHATEAVEALEDALAALAKVTP